MGFWSWKPKEKIIRTLSKLEQRHLKTGVLCGMIVLSTKELMFEMQNKDKLTQKDLQELLTPEFLSTLHTAVECCNWDVDMVETMEFCNWCYSKAGTPGPYYDMSFEMEDEE
jgi:hypothetical protein